MPASDCATPTRRSRDDGRALEAIIFDFDGVIADSERLHLRAYQDLLAPFAPTLPGETYFATYLGYDDRGPLRAHARANDVGWDEETIGWLVASRASAMSRRAGGEMLFPGAADFIRHAAARVPIAIASGAMTHEIEEVLDQAEL